MYQYSDIMYSDHIMATCFDRKTVIFRAIQNIFKVQQIEHSVGSRYWNYCNTLQVNSASCWVLLYGYIAMRSKRNITIRCVCLFVHWDLLARVLTAYLELMSCY